MSNSGHKRHRAESWVVKPFTGPVSLQQNQMAHGGRCFVMRCKCGAERRINENGRHIERGPWEEPQ